MGDNDIKVQKIIDQLSKIFCQEHLCLEFVQIMYFLSQEQNKNPSSPIWNMLNTLSEAKVKCQNKNSMFLEFWCFFEKSFKPGKRTLSRE
jgi:hypothetical protein